MTVWWVDPPPTGIGTGVRCTVSWVADKGGELGVLTSGREGTRDSVRGGVVPTRNSWDPLINRKLINVNER